MSKSNFNFQTWAGIFPQREAMQPGQPGFLQAATDTHLQTGGQEHEIPDYWRLSATLENEGFKPTPYFDVQQGQLVETLIKWTQPTTGRVCIQRANFDGESTIFLINSALDIQSQLSALSDWLRPEQPVELNEPTICE